MFEADLVCIHQVFCCVMYAGGLGGIGMGLGPGGQPINANRLSSGGGMGSGGHSGEHSYLYEENSGEEFCF